MTNLIESHSKGLFLSQYLFAIKIDEQEHVTHSRANVIPNNREWEQQENV